MCVHESISRQLIVFTTTLGCIESQHCQMWQQKKLTVLWMEGYVVCRDS